MAANNSNGGTGISWRYSYIIGIVIGSVLITIIFTCFGYLTLRYMKKKLSRPKYYVDDVSIQKDGNEYYIENKDVSFQDPYIHRIQPILTVSEVVSSIKQALENLGNAVTPHRWSTAEQKSDLPI